MSKTDGIGTWVWNENINFPEEGSYFEFTFFSDEIEFFALEVFSGGLDYSYGDGSIIPAYNLEDGWYLGLDSPYRTIDIKTAPPAEFLTILQANAVYQEATPDKYKLLDQNGNLLEINGMTKGTLTYEGKTYEWDNGASETPTDELLGTWVFNETLNIPESSNVLDFNFDFLDGTTSKKGIGILLEYDNGESFDPSEPLYSLSYALEVDISGGPTAPDYISCYFSRSVPDIDVTLSGWQNQSYRTITITDTSSLTNRDEFTTWLKANAVKQGGPEPVSGIGTWIWNEEFDSELFVGSTFNFSFSSHSIDFSAIEFGPRVDPTLYYNDPNGMSLPVYSRLWEDEAYRTINITSEPPAEFLEILKANAVKQA